MSEDDSPPERPAGACATCAPPRGRAWTRADDRYATCSGCSRRMRESLAEIAERYLLLDPRPGANAEAGARGAPGFVSRPPINMHVAAMRDPRSSQDSRMWVGGDGRVHSEEVNPPRSVYGVLSTLSWSVADSRGVSGPGDRDDVYALVRFLDRHIDSHVTRVAELAVEVDRGLRDLVAVLRPLTGDRVRRIGQCPRPHPDPPEGAEEGLKCGTPLYGGWDSDEVRCRSCDYAWSFDRWLTVGDEAESAYADMDA